MSDHPDPQDGGEELDLGEIDEAEDQEADALADGEEGDAGDDDGQGQEEEGDVDPPPRQGRKSQAQRWRERSERNERELQALKNQFQGFTQASQTRQPQIDPLAAQRQQEELDARLSMMSPQEIARYYYQQGQQQIQQVTFYQNLQLEDKLDKRDFDAAARTDRKRAQYRDRVEQAYNAEIQAGNLRAKRDDIFHLLSSRDAEARATRDTPRQRRAAAANVARQQTRPGGARGDGAAGGRRPAPGTPEDDDRIIEEGFRNGMRL
jgi:hypothetical protein